MALKERGCRLDSHGSGCGLVASETSVAIKCVAFLEKVGDLLADYKDSASWS
jgi:hypothetical protein